MIDTNKKLIILLVLAILSIVSFLYLQNIQVNQLQSFKSYEKTANEIAIIKQLKEYYGDKKSNTRKINNIIDKYKSKIVNKKEDKNSLEFTATKLNHTELDDINQMLLNSGVKIVKINIKRVDPQTGEFFCKVIF
jgi:type II secretory pathway pseudopilin PulG